jgi:hypothetical protein
MAAAEATPDIFSRGIELSITKTVGFLSEMNGAAIVKGKNNLCV